MKHKITIKNSETSIGDMSKNISIKGVSHLLEEKNSDVIELESYEIGAFKAFYENDSEKEDGSGAKKRNQLKIEIVGKIIPETTVNKEVSVLYEKDGKGELLPVNNGELDVNQFRLNEIREELEDKKGKLHVGALNMKNKVFTSNDSRTTDINLNKIKRWCYMRNKSPEYRDVIVNIETSEGIFQEIYKEMYIEDYDATFVLDKGEGEFRLLLAQRLRDEKGSNNLNLF